VFYPAVGGGHGDYGVLGDGGGGVEGKEVYVHLCREAFWDVGGRDPASEGN
jgi:hypothetical protein